MLKIKVKENKKFYDIIVKGRKTNKEQVLSVVKTLFSYLKKEYRLTDKEIIGMLVEFNKSTRLYSSTINNKGISKVGKDGE